jgi:hypothetical protein
MSAYRPLIDIDYVISISNSVLLLTICPVSFKPWGKP